jgi:hypothetical protein
MTAKGEYILHRDEALFGQLCSSGFAVGNKATNPFALIAGFATLRLFH